MPLATPVCGPHFKSFYEYRFPYYFKHVLLRTYFQIEKSYYITRVRTQHLQIKSQGSTRLIQLPGAAVSMNSSTIASSSKIIHIVYNMFFFKFLLSNCLCRLLVATLCCFCAHCLPFIRPRTVRYAQLVSWLVANRLQWFQCYDENSFIFVSRFHSCI